MKERSTPDRLRDDGLAELPKEVEDLITRALAEFAEGASFELRPLYHGESLWFLKREEGGLVKRVQVSASGVWPFIKLSFIPDAIAVDEARSVMRTIPAVPQEWIRVLSWFQFTMPESKPSVITDEAWNAAKALDSIDESMLSVELPIEARRNKA